LDPALPGFIYLTDRLSRKDADFVDVIHTCGGFLGILSQIGHVDFYPNGGTPPQPGCSGVDEIIKACSHGQSWVLFEESINANYEAYKCDSWDDFELGICIKEKVLFGDPVPPTARGSYYFYTKKK
ncbi:lipoprotein lipase-like, partial [Agrilus planipennis]|uniref:Lipoprotein lipase-like n=1 Tax=Agrilus planipennis TaxID=224129 RepID=A0A1W4XQX1_AGRPL